MKIIKSEKYKQALDWRQKMQDMMGGAAEQMNKNVDDKAAQYAQMVIDLINKGTPQQAAFDQVMAQMGIGPPMQVFRGKVIAKIKELYTPQAPTGKTYDQQYPGTTTSPQAIPI